jgi:hypothetical protein
MNSDLARAVIVPVLVLTLAGCATNAVTEKPGDLKFGDANRQTMMAQVIDPDPVYTQPAQSSGAHAADAVERYRTDKVKQPDSVRTTTNAASPPQ